MSNIINGKEVANSICQQLKETIERSDVIPCLAVIIVGNRTDSKTYVRMKRKRCKEIGIESICIELDENVIQEQIIEHIHLLNNNTNEQDYFLIPPGLYNILTGPISNI